MEDTPQKRGFLFIDIQDCQSVHLLCWKIPYSIQTNHFLQFKKLILLKQGNMLDEIKQNRIYFFMYIPTFREIIYD